MGQQHDEISQNKYETAYGQISQDYTKAVQPSLVSSLLSRELSSLWKFNFCSLNRRDQNKRCCIVITPKVNWFTLKTEKQKDYLFFSNSLVAWKIGQGQQNWQVFGWHADGPRGSTQLWVLDNKSGSWWKIWFLHIIGRFCCCCFFFFFSPKYKMTGTVIKIYDVHWSSSLSHYIRGIKTLRKIQHTWSFFFCFPFLVFLFCTV